MILLLLAASIAAALGGFALPFWKFVVYHAAGRIIKCQIYSHAAVWGLKFLAG